MVEKPTGLLVHPTKPGGPRTLLDELRELLAYELVNGGQVSLIHRLDRETSGLMLVAKNYEAARDFSQLMQRGEIHKEYLLLVRGWPDWDTHCVRQPILRLGAVEPFRVWLKRGVHPDGDEACTEFVVESRVELSDGRRVAQLRAYPRTGRTHQIRVHAAHLGFPLVGDKLYGPCEQHYLDFIDTGWTPELQQALWWPRHALHSARLQFPYGDFASELPDDLQQFLRT